jgi:hypothetical protein
MEGTFGKLKIGELFFCSGTEYIKVGKQGAIAISPLVTRFSSDEQVVRAKQTTTTVGNWKWGRPNIESVEDVKG